MGATGVISNKILECLLCLCCSLLKLRAKVKAFAAGESHLQPSTGPPPELPQTGLAEAEFLVLAPKHGTSAVQRELGICTQLKPRLGEHNLSPERAMPWPQLSQDLDLLTQPTRT